MLNIKPGWMDGKAAERLMKIQACDERSVIYNGRLS